MRSSPHFRTDRIGGRAASQALVSYLSKVLDMTCPAARTYALITGAKTYSPAPRTPGHPSVHPCYSRTCAEACVEKRYKCGKPVIHMCTVFVNRLVTQKLMHGKAVLHTGLSLAYATFFPRPRGRIERRYTRLIPTIHMANNRYYGIEMGINYKKTVDGGYS